MVAASEGGEGGGHGRRMQRRSSVVGDCGCGSDTVGIRKEMGDGKERFIYLQCDSR